MAKKERFERGRAHWHVVGRAQAVTGDVRLRERPDLTDAQWDALVSSYPAATIFHQSCWHRVLNATKPGQVLRFEVEHDGRLCGHWCGFLLRKFGLKVFGAPLPGTATDYMHPLFSVAPPPKAFLEALWSWAKGRRLGLVEVGGDYFSEAGLVSHGYTTLHTRSYRVDLSSGENAVWKQLKPAMRNKVRKAEKSGVRIAEDTPLDFPQRFFHMLEDVFRRQGASSTYSLKLVESVVRILGQSGNLKTLTAWHNDEALVSLILLVDRHALYLWGAASYTSAYRVGANDLTHWHALRFATHAGIPIYDTCGGGDYKEKFGGTLVHIPAGFLAVNPLFGQLRPAVRRAVSARQRVLGKLRNLGKGHK